VTEPADAPVVREMGYSLDEFTRVLPLAMRDWQVGGGPLNWQVRDAAGDVDVEIELRPLPDRRIGALSLPVLSVTIDPRATPAALMRNFMRRFDRGFHRGGG